MSMLPPPNAGPTRSSLDLSGGRGLQTMQQGLDGKASHDDVQYQERSTDPTKDCDGCKFFQPPQSCRNVVDPINPEGLCIMFEPMKGANEATEGEPTAPVPPGPPNGATGQM